MAKKPIGKIQTKPRGVKPAAVKPSATKPWDVTEHLRTDTDMAAYLDAVLEDGDPALIVAALGDVARARGMTEIAKTAGLGRTNLYKALSPDGRPEFATVLKIVRALGLKLTVAAQSLVATQRVASSSCT